MEETNKLFKNPLVNETPSNFETGREAFTQEGSILFSQSGIGKLYSFLGEFTKMYDTPPTFDLYSHLHNQVTANDLKPCEVVSIFDEQEEGVTGLTYKGNLIIEHLDYFIQVGNKGYRSVAYELIPKYSPDISLANEGSLFTTNSEGYYLSLSKLMGVYNYSVKNKRHIINKFLNYRLTLEASKTLEDLLQQEEKIDIELGYTSDLQHRVVVIYTLDSKEELEEQSKLFNNEAVFYFKSAVSKDKELFPDDEELPW